MNSLFFTVIIVFIDILDKAVCQVIFSGFLKNFYYIEIILLFSISTHAFGCTEIIINIVIIDFMFWIVDSGFMVFYPFYKQIERSDTINPKSKIADCLLKFSFF
jgi:hypothetical protein